jgi:hypothetical protein
MFCDLSIFYKIWAICQGVAQIMCVRLELNFDLCVSVNVAGLMRPTSPIIWIPRVGGFSTQKVELTHTRPVKRK